MLNLPRGVLKRHQVRQVLCAVLVFRGELCFLKFASFALASLNLLTLVFLELKLRTESLVLLLQLFAFLFFNNSTELQCSCL